MPRPMFPVCEPSKIVQRISILGSRLGSTQCVLWMASATRPNGGAAKTRLMWLWSPADGAAELPLHPSEIPTTDAERHWKEGYRGPRLAKIAPVTVVGSRGDFLLIEGASKPVPKSSVLP
eukprot:5535559-Amphidinium_carterae.1